jgi:hypothetical protein
MSETPGPSGTQFKKEVDDEVDQTSPSMQAVEVPAEYVTDLETELAATESDLTFTLAEIKEVLDRLRETYYQAHDLLDSNSDIVTSASIIDDFVEDLLAVLRKRANSE